jgi:hypothetical protein
MIIDGFPPAIIDEIFTNKITFEKDEYTRQYKTILKRAILGIQEGLNNRILYYTLGSYTGLTPKEMNNLDYELLRDIDDDTPNGTLYEPDKLDLD